MVAVDGGGWRQQEEQEGLETNTHPLHIHFKYTLQSELHCHGMAALDFLVARINGQMECIRMNSNSSSNTAQGGERKAYRDTLDARRQLFSSFGDRR